MVVPVHSEDRLRHEVFLNPGKDEDNFTFDGSITRLYANNQAILSIFLIALHMLYTANGPLGDVGNDGRITRNQHCRVRQYKGYSL